MKSNCVGLKCDNPECNWEDDTINPRKAFTKKLKECYCKGDIDTTTPTTTLTKIKMNKSIEIKHFPLIDYNTTLQVVAEYIKQHQFSREKLDYEKHIFDLTTIVYGIECHKHPVTIEIENSWSSFWVKVRETKTKYIFEIWHK